MPLDIPKDPKSLLNGQRMYHELLEALKDMDDRGSSGFRGSTPYVKELDLFVTATDMRGLPVPLKLEGTLAWEKRHRNVFHFRYNKEQSGKGCNDFREEYNPFLAFAARATSAFPFAFEPIKLNDISSVRGTPKTPTEFWSRFFPEYRRPPGLDAKPSQETARKRTQGPDEKEYEYEERAFGDGGYLDNKPFGHAIEVLAKRRSGLPVDRKLIYVDPSPEHPEANEWEDGSGNAIVNLAAASKLARYEPIREDLQRILRRNRLIERVQSIVADQETDSDIRQAGVRNARPPDERFVEADLGAMIQNEGIAYGSYHRLRIAAATDAIATMIASAGNFDAGSDEFFAIRYLVRAWRERKYAARHQRERETQNQFLWRYDLDYRIRRAEFFLSRIDQLYRLSDKGCAILERKGCRIPNSEEDKRVFREELVRLCRDLTAVLAALREARRQLELPGEQNPLHEACQKTGLGWKELREILEEPSEETRSEKAEEIMCDPSMTESFHRIARDLQEHIECPMNRADTYRAIFTRSNIEGRSSGSGGIVARMRGLLCEGDADFAAIARELVDEYYAFYLRYDMITYPILYSTEVGDEIDQVEVVRISPEDACYLEGGRLGSGKLVGTSLRNFGAFFDRGFRQNDILWGRLDGAERLISTLLTNSEHSTEDRGRLIEKAQLQILEEELRIPDRSQLAKLVGDAMTKADSAGDNGTELRKLAEQERNSSGDSALRAVLSKETLYDFYSESYKPSRQLNPQATIHVLARSARVVGMMFEGIAKKSGNGRKAAAWAARLGRVFAGIVEVSTRGRLGNWIWRRWLVLLYAFEALLILAGLLLSADVYRFGLSAFAITAVLHVSTLALGDFMRSKKRWLHALMLSVIFIAVLAVVGWVLVLFVGPPELTVSWVIDRLQAQLSKLENR